jgi:hypothetical protein
MLSMASSFTPGPSPQERAALDALVGDLKRVFGARLQSVVLYGLDDSGSNGRRLRTLGFVERLTFEDLHKCAPLATGWRQRSLAVPLLLTRDEFERTLDVFPLEYGSIIARHIVIAGENPFSGTRIADADRRRGCELQAKSHLIHLREGFLEAMGDGPDVARLIAASVPSFRMLLRHIAELETAGSGDWSDQDLAAMAERVIGVPAALVTDVLASPVSAGTIAEPTALLARYIDASERIWRYVDSWRS